MLDKVVPYQKIVGPSDTFGYDRPQGKGVGAEKSVFRVFCMGCHEFYMGGDFKL